MKMLWVLILHARIPETGSEGWWAGKGMTPVIGIYVAPFYVQLDGRDGPSPFWVTAPTGARRDERQACLTINYLSLAIGRAFALPCFLSKQKALQRRFNIIRKFAVAYRKVASLKNMTLGMQRKHAKQ